MSFFSFLVLYAPEGDLYFPFRENIFLTKDIVEHKNEKKEHNPKIWSSLSFPKKEKGKIIWGLEKKPNVSIFVDSIP